MNTFLTIMCFTLVAMAVAKPGYNYQQPQQPFISSTSVQQGPQLTSFNVQSQYQPIQQNFVSSVSGPAPAPGPVFSPVPQTAPQTFEVAGQQVQYAQQQFATPTQLFTPPASQFVGPAPQFVAPVQQQTVYTPGAQVVSSSQHTAQPQQQTIVSKEIYIHSSPEETEEINADQGIEAGPNRKNYRIVFIKAPSHNIKFNVNSLKRAQAANEEKTVIYVLSKKPDLATIQNQLTAVQGEQKTHKPEVYFIKYKTQQEANRAQQEIQAQYDALGGSTHISDEGIAPVTSVIGGKSVNIGSVGPVVGTSSGPVFTSGSSYSSGPSFTSGPSYTSGPSFSSGSNFVQSTGGNQQTFVQQSFHGGQSTGSTVSFGAEAPSQKYLPAQKK